MHEDKIHDKLRDDMIRDKILDGKLRKQDYDNDRVFQFLKLLEVLVGQRNCRIKETTEEE